MALLGGDKVAAAVGGVAMGIGHEELLSLARCMRVCVYVSHGGEQYKG